MERKAYSAGAVKLPFWFMEFRKEVGMLTKGQSFDDIKQANEMENIFGAPTAARAKQIYQTVTNRIQNLGDGFYYIFQESDIATQKIISLAAVMATDSLFCDFMYEVIREKMLIGSEEFADSDIRIFFKNKQLQDEKVAEWTDQTLHRLGGCYKNYLLEAGMTDKGLKVRKIYRPILDPVFEGWLRDNDMEIIARAIAGEQ